MKIFKKKEKREAGGASATSQKNEKVESHNKTTREVELEKRLSEKQAELDDALEGLAEAREILKEHSKARKELDREKEELEKQVREITERNRGLKADNTKLSMDVESLQDAVKEAKDALEEKGKELEKSKAYFSQQMTKELTRKKTEPNRVPAAEMEELKWEVEALTKHKEELEKKLVDLTGLSILKGELESLKKQNETLKEQLGEEKSAAQNARVQLKQMGQESDATVEILRENLKREEKRREELEAKLQQVEEVDLSSSSKSEARIRELESKVADLESRLKQAEFSKPALEGQTAALILAETNKVREEERKKCEEEIEQILADQKQAMEALVKAVRAEEQLHMRPRRGSSGSEPSQPKKAFLPFSAFFSRAGSSSDEGGLSTTSSRVDESSKSTENQETVNQPEQIQIQPKLPRVDVTVVSKVHGDAPSTPVRLHLDEDLTENTADVARASLDYMSL